MRKVGDMLLPALLERATEMSFFRFCELVELCTPHRAALGCTDTPMDEPIRFRSRAGLGFPGRELDAVELDDGESSAAPVVRTTFLGLYGVDARMPAYFADEIAQNREGAFPLAAFLDIFHHRIATQFYRIWKKYRYPVGFRNDGDDEVSRCLLSLAGLGIGEHAAWQQVGARKLVSMLGLASQKTRTAEGLIGMLRHVAQDTDIEVQQCHSVWVVPDAVEAAPLGQGCLLGRGFHDRMNAVLVVFRPKTQQAMRDLMPTQEPYRQVMALLRFYLGYEVQAHLRMDADTSLFPRPVFGDPLVKLGLTSRLPGHPFGREAISIQLGIYAGA